MNSDLPLSWQILVAESPHQLSASAEEFMAEIARILSTPLSSDILIRSVNQTPNITSDLQKIYWDLHEVDTGDVTPEDRTLLRKSYRHMLKSGVIRAIPDQGPSYYRTVDQFRSRFCS